MSKVGLRAGSYGERLVERYVPEWPDREALTHEHRHTHSMRHPHAHGHRVGVAQRTLTR